MFILTPSKQQDINKNEGQSVGVLDIKWQNYLGDLGSIRVGPFKYGEPKVKYDISIEIVDKNNKLILEEPGMITCKLGNLSKRVLNILLDVGNDNQSLPISGLSRYNLGHLAPGVTQEFEVFVFPKDCGIHNLRGIKAKDLTTQKEWIFQNLGDFLIEYSHEMAASI